MKRLKRERDPKDERERREGSSQNGGPMRRLWRFIVVHPIGTKIWRTGSSLSLFLASLTANASREE